MDEQYVDSLAKEIQESLEPFKYIDLNKLKETIQKHFKNIYVYTKDISSILAIDNTLCKEDALQILYTAEIKNLLDYDSLVDITEAHKKRNNK